MKRSAWHITDHAVVRYLERVRGLDVDAVRAEIADKVAPAGAAGASGLVSEGFRYVLENGSVVTVKSATRTELHIGRYRRRREVDDE